MKRLLLVFFILSVFLFPACNKDSQSVSEEKPAEPTYRISDYYPFLENTRLEYEGSGNEYAEQTVYIDFTDKDRMQLRVINPGTTLGRVLENKDGELRILLNRGEFYYRENILYAASSKPETLLKEPLVKGTEWKLEDGRRRFISGIDVKISTPSGDYKALEVTTEGGDYTNMDYYVRGIGHVLSRYKSGESEITTSLKSIQKSVRLDQTVKFYYPDFMKDRVVFIKEKISLKTNEDINKIFEEHFKNPPSKDLSSLISSNTKILKLSFNPSENKVYINFSKELVTEMNAGTTLEGMLIQSITNTLGDYFNVDKVFISIEGKPYESGHILLNSSESFFVDYKNVSEYK